MNTYPSKETSGAIQGPRLRLRWLVLLLVVSALLPSALIYVGEAQAATTGPCTCVEYVKRYFALTGSVGNAKDMGPALVSRGFRKLSSPNEGAVIIFQPSFGQGVDAKYGHVAVIRSFKPVDGGRNWEVQYRGAAQSAPSVHTHLGCTNVSYKTKVYSKNSSSVSYYKR